MAAHIHRDTYFSVSFHLDDLFAQLHPFVEAVHRGVVELGSLRPAVLRAAALHPRLTPFFCISEDEIDETFGLRAEYLFPREMAIKEIEIGNRQTGRRFRFPAEDLPIVERCMSLCGFGASERAIREEIDDELVDALLREGHLRLGEARASLTRSKEPGIVRLQHASLLFRSETTGILVDPHFHSAYEPQDIGDTFASSDLRESVDAILISHAHADHFSLSTLMLFPRDIPIIVPHVPRSNIIAADMAHLLRSVGFTRVMDPKWFSSPLMLGDFEIHVLPFYGEQPLRDESPRHPDLRNWGNTYYLRSPQYSSWFLIDSGDDPRGRMAHVAEHVASRLGGVDHLLSNLNVFCVGAGDGNPNYITSKGQYWLSLTASQMARFSSLCGQQITLGPRGVAEVARIARAKTFLPYAHWWSAVGSQPIGEARRLQRLAQASDDLGARMEIVPWRVGETFTQRRCPPPLLGAGRAT